MNNNIIRKQKIIDHLTWLIETRYGWNNMWNAIDKWENDRAFVSKYKLDEAKAVNVRLIRTKW